MVGEILNENDALNAVFELYSYGNVSQNEYIKMMIYKKRYVQGKLKQETIKKILGDNGFELEEIRHNTYKRTRQPVS